MRAMVAKSYCIYFALKLFLKFWLTHVFIYKQIKVSNNQF